jgi:riboflavin biosynthesis pyrimidine reductase
MSALITTMETLYEQDGGIELPLPHDLKAIYGPFQLPSTPTRPYVIANFVTTLDGVTSLNVPGHSAGGDISGFNAHDRIVMGLLRAVADAVIVGAGTLRSVPDHLWTADYIYPALKDSYTELRTNLGKTEPPLNVIITASGQVDSRLRLFQTGEVPVLIVTTQKGHDQISQRELPPSVQIAVTEGTGKISASAMLAAVVPFCRQSDLILVEGGPQLMASFFEEKCLDELYLTLAPQIAGRDPTIERPGIVAGKMFGPEEPLWGTLAGVKRSGSHLFLRYVF